MKKTQLQLSILGAALIMLLIGAKTNYCNAQPYQDQDNDGYGSTITDPGGVANNLDCDDYCATCYPGSPEVLDGLDNDCDNQIDNGLMTVSVGADAEGLFGYAAGQDISRTVTVANGYPPFTYTWTMDRALICNYLNSSGDELFYGGTCVDNICPGSGSLSNSPSCDGSTINTRLMENATICVTVTDAQNSTASDCFFIHAEDARCKVNNGNNVKINVCHHTGSQSNPWVQICVSENAVPAHLGNHGDYVGTCGQRKPLDSGTAYEFSVNPNPSTGLFNVQYDSRTNAPLNIRVDNIFGQVVYIETIASFAGTLDMSLDLGFLDAGVYVISVNDGTNFGSHRIVVSK